MSQVFCRKLLFFYKIHSSISILNQTELRLGLRFMMRMRLAGHVGYAFAESITEALAKGLLDLLKLIASAFSFRRLAGFKRLLGGFLVDDASENNHLLYNYNMPIGSEMQFIFKMHNIIAKKFFSTYPDSLAHRWIAPKIIPCRRP